MKDQSLAAACPIEWPSSTTCDRSSVSFLVWDPGMRLGLLSLGTRPNTQAIYWKLTILTSILAAWHGHRWANTNGRHQSWQPDTDINECLPTVNIDHGNPTWTSMSVYWRSTPIFTAGHPHGHRDPLDIDIDTDLQFCPHPRSIVTCVWLCNTNLVV